MKNWQRLKKNPELWKIYDTREAVIDVIRAFFKKQNFREAFTPILVPVPSTEANLEVFETQIRFAGREGEMGGKRGFLIMSPEYSLKKLITAGSGNIFEITKCFRNEEQVSESHNPEFTMLEWYRVRADYKVIMEDFEELFIEIIKKTNAAVDVNKWTYQGEEYNISRPWMKVSVSEAFWEFANINTETMLDPMGLAQEMKKYDYQMDENTTWEQMFHQILFGVIEPKLKDLRRPVFIYDYPTALAALARKKPEDERFAERFEVYLGGLELGNCFSELIDAEEQKARFKAELDVRKKTGKTDYPMDVDLINALTSGMPETAGIAVGVDRLVMLAGDAGSISETLAFPAKELFL